MDVFLVSHSSPRHLLPLFIHRSPVYIYSFTSILEWMPMNPWMGILKEWEWEESVRDETNLLSNPWSTVKKREKKRIRLSSSLWICLHLLLPWIPVSLFLSPHSWRQRDPVSGLITFFLSLSLSDSLILLLRPQDHESFKRDFRLLCWLMHCISLWHEKKRREKRKKETRFIGNIREKNEREAYALLFRILHDSFQRLEAASFPFFHVKHRLHWWRLQFMPDDGTYTTLPLMLLIMNITMPEDVILILLFHAKKINKNNKEANLFGRLHHLLFPKS